MTESVLDGTSQFALLTLLLAVVAYIRTVPYKQLAEKRVELNKAATGNEAVKSQLRDVLAQMIVLDGVQIVCAALGVLLVGRTLWGSCFDGLILLTLFLLAVLMLLFHLKTNLAAIAKAVKKYPCD
ncbi:hypothetical protein MPL1_12558 [Methylophaga lonarensis MPL]|uniref:Integral membrane protein n=1 Tax=Methylophaga lonarensis MPL TaxID=1286106 RepID=M7NXN2_9GAMM|nr:hypothetical protein [Methylophaga lonarensis]EMR12027.1 hypothetical protein MPL1_12558 [Methylophaga lonarensis MPL]